MDYFDATIERYTRAPRVINYPEQQEAPLAGQLRVGERSDYGSFTILRRENDQRPGRLQALWKRFMAVSHLPAGADGGRVA